MSIGDYALHRASIICCGLLHIRNRSACLGSYRICNQRFALAITSDFLLRTRNSRIAIPQQDHCVGAMDIQPNAERYDIRSSQED
jgi:hypothetical protein